MDFDTRPAAYAVIERDGEVLLTHYTISVGAAWSMPGGAIELRESPEECVVREVKEETGYDVVVEELVHVGHIWIPPERRERKNGDRYLLGLPFVFRATIVGGTFEREVGGSTDDLRWVPVSELESYAQPSGWPVNVIRKALNNGI